MNIFSDFHHDDLYHSLHLLFEGRLGYTMYCPIGLEWYASGYWKYTPEFRVVQQFLGAGQKVENVGDYCLVANPCHERNIKALTLEQFKAMDIDLVICSVPEHLYTFQKLIADFHPKAKLIFQIGNNWENVNYEDAGNLLISCAPFDLPSGVNAIFYHQEFDLGLFSFERGDPAGPINSFVNDLPHLKGYPDFLKYEAAILEKKWFSYGGGCRDGNLRPLSKLVDVMKGSSLIYHDKSLGDGFGHIIHNLFAIGRPGIIRTSYYKGKAAYPLFEDGVTCIDLDAHSFDESCKLIREALEPDKYHALCDRSFQRFNEVVNYDNEEVKIREFLDRLI